MNYLRNSDWGKFWVCDKKISTERLIEHSLSSAAQRGLQLSLSSERFETTETARDLYEAAMRTKKTR